MTMKIDTEIRLFGDDALDFYNRMMFVDLDMIAQRDMFISSVDWYLDDNGILTINIDDLDIDL